MHFFDINDDYEEARRKTELFYKNIGQIWCPSLNDVVIFNDAGLKHLIKKGRLPRPKSEQKRRFFMLRYVKEILRTKHPFSIDERVVAGVVIRCWKFVDTKNGHTIKIVVRQVEGRKKHFLSVYGKIKNPRRTA